jgi:hypothetical protein
MATFLQLGILNYFSIIFPALLVFVIVFALFQKYKILGDNKSVHTIIAIALAFLVILSASMVELINVMAPWFVVIFVFMVLLLVLFKLMGASDETISSMFIKNKSIQWLIIGIAFIILVAALAHVYGARLAPAAAVEGEVVAEETGEPTTFGQNVVKILFNPLILGIVFILLLAVFTIALITKERL